VTPTVPLKPNGNGKKKVQLGLADWCGFCTKLKSELPKVKKMLAEAGIEVEIIKDKADLDKMMKENKQNGFPFAVLVDEDGVVVDSFGGFMPAEPYVQRIKSKLA
jgi:thiol-disulfide isomerase/thioredoxin